jgi:hypothetical protein
MLWFKIQHVQPPKRQRRRVRELKELRVPTIPPARRTTFPGNVRYLRGRGVLNDASALEHWDGPKQHNRTVSFSLGTSVLIVEGYSDRSFNALRRVDARKRGLI